MKALYDENEIINYNNETLIFKMQNLNNMIKDLILSDNIYKIFLLKIKF